MTISYIDKRRKETKFVSFRGGRKTCCQVFSSICKGTTFFRTHQIFSQLFFVSITSFLLYLIPKKQELKKGDRNYRLLRIWYPPLARLVEKVASATFPPYLQ